MDLTLIAKLAAAGAMGVSIYCIIKIYDLLKNEQNKQRPRQSFIKTIYVSMGFAILMTMLSLGIEIVRFNMDTHLSQLEKDLKHFDSEKYYSVDSNGNPKEIKLEYKQKTYVLGKSFPKNQFETSELKLKKAENEGYYAIKENIGDSVTFGYVSNDQIISKTKDLFDDINNKSLNINELWSLGWLYTPSNTAKIIKYEAKEDRFLANEYLIKILRKNDKDNSSLSERAIKLLTQPELMNKLMQDQYDILINALQSGIRETPWDKYELAQVHLSRSGQTWNKENMETDKNISLQFFKDFTDYYETNSWIRDSKYSTENNWYNECKEKLNLSLK